MCGRRCRKAQRVGILLSKFIQMKKLLIILITFISLSIQAQDVTGTWRCACGYTAEWFQEGQNVYSIYNVGNYKHYLSGRFISANQIEARTV